MTVIKNAFQSREEEMGSRVLQIQNELEELQQRSLYAPMVGARY